MPGGVPNLPPKSSRNKPRAPSLGQVAAATGALRRDVGLHDVQVMLAEARDSAFSGAGWLFELKFDGYRVLAKKRGDQVTLRYRSGRDATPLFPEIVAAIRALPVEEALIDGEACV